MSSQLPRLGLSGIGGISQMSAASQALLSRANGGRSNGGGRKKKRAAKSARRKKARAGLRTRSNGGSRAGKKTRGKKPWMVKGSAAAKRRMSQLRKMRK